MRAFEANWGVFAAFLVVAGGVSLATAFTTMPPLDENGRPVMTGGRVADASAGASRPAMSHQRTDPFVFALEMTNPLSRRANDDANTDLAVEVEPGLAEQAPAQTTLAAVPSMPPLPPDEAPLAAEMLEIARHLAAIAPAAGSQETAPPDAGLIDSAVAAPTSVQVAQLPSARGLAGSRTETLFGSYRASEDSAHQWGTASAREHAAETAARTKTKAPIETLPLVPEDPPLQKSVPEEPAAKKPAVEEPVAENAPTTTSPRAASGTTLAAVVVAAVAPAAGDTSTGELAAATTAHSKISVAPASGVAAPARTSRYVVIGSFKRLANARVLQRERQAWSPDILAAEVKGQAYHRVALGPFSLAEAKQVRQSMAAQGIDGAWTLAPPKDATVTLRRSAELGLKPAG